MYSQKLNETAEQMEEEEISQVRFYYFLDRKSEMQVAVKTGRSIIMPKNEHTKANLNMLMFDCKSKQSSHFTAADIFEGALNQPSE